ncbi:hypothetical protein MTAT_19490 [Moorella thermoacetica]|uniref:Uncharacterized protein n=1 Tax=Neomoorella thermoacetica TaxID=1525 RepID=A0AAC9HK71_NEOTH|nr:hypothetical protein [Moorella thermoacetica]AOQ24606.1 hypothetical protein Maut_02176 [Moorella thermoacetica]TYL12707.1 hypothetical protein MTAT_19490 [Moorella thermoacetica]
MANTYLFSDWYSWYSTTCDITWNINITASLYPEYSISFSIGPHFFAFEYTNAELYEYSSREFLAQHAFDLHLSLRELVIMLGSSNCPAHVHKFWYDVARANQEENTKFAVGLYWAILSHPNPSLELVLGMSCVDIPALKPLVQEKLKQITRSNIRG